MVCVAGMVGSTRLPRVTRIIDPAAIAARLSVIPLTRMELVSA